MKTALTATQMLIRLTSLILLALGLLVWTGRSRSLIPVHLMLGAFFVVMLWALAYLGIQTGAKPALVVLVVLWSLIMLALGVAQTRMLVGSPHWIIQALHLLVGMVAIGLAEGLGGRIKRRMREGPG